MNSCRIFVVVWVFLTLFPFYSAHSQYAEARKITPDIELTRSDDTVYYLVVWCNNDSCLNNRQYVVGSNGIATAKIFAKGIGSGIGNDSWMTFNVKCKENLYQIILSDEGYKKAKKGTIASDITKGICRH